MPERATLEELKVFANKVREAGGADPIDSLMPGVPMDSKKCLIANNLNFACEVCGGTVWDAADDDWIAVNYEDGTSAWFMYTGDQQLAEKIGLALDLEFGEYRYDEDSAWAVKLPQKIAQVAVDYDRTLSMLRHLKYPHTQDRPDVPMSVVREMIPYITADYMQSEGMDYDEMKGLVAEAS